MKDFISSIARSIFFSFPLFYGEFISVRAAESETFGRAVQNYSLSSIPYSNFLSELLFLLIFLCILFYFIFCLKIKKGWRRLLHSKSFLPSFGRKSCFLLDFCCSAPVSLSLDWPLKLKTPLLPPIICLIHRKWQTLNFKGSTKQRGEVQLLKKTEGGKNNKKNKNQKQKLWRRKKKKKRRTSWSI